LNQISVEYIMSQSANLTVERREPQNPQQWKPTHCSL